MPRERIVVLVAASKAEAKYARELRNAMEASGKLRGSHRVVEFDGDEVLKKRGGLSLSRRLKPGEAVRDELTDWLNAPQMFSNQTEDDPELTLIGVARGCGAIKEYVLHSLAHESTVRAVRRVRSALFLESVKPRFSTKSLVLAEGVGLAVVAAILFALIQIYSLHSAALVLASYLAAAISTVSLAVWGAGQLPGWIAGRLGDAWQVDREFDRCVVRGSVDQPGTWPIATTEFGRRPSPANEAELGRVLDLVLRPPGHPHVLQIERYQRTTELSPITTEELPGAVRERLVTDNVANYTAEIRFAANDRSSTRDAGSQPAIWVLDYTTSNGYLIEMGQKPSDHIALPSDGFNARHCGSYRFRIEPGKTGKLRVTIYGGYNEGDRTGHSHLRPYAYYDLYRETLDLTGYANKGWRVKQPRVYFRSEGPFKTKGDRDICVGCDCASREIELESGLRLDVRQIRDAVFSWEMEGVRDGGAVSFFFEVERPRG